MNSDESSRGMMSNYMNRKQYPPKYGDKNHTYSPSANFNYGNSSYNGQQQQRPHRRPPFKKDNYNSNDRLIKQNDIIIRLLKEIRDRLPAPSMEENDFMENLAEQRNMVNDMQEHHNSSDLEDDADGDEVLMEPADENFTDEQDSFTEEEDGQ